MLKQDCTVFDQELLRLWRTLHVSDCRTVTALCSLMPPDVPWDSCSSSGPHNAALHLQTQGREVARAGQTEHYMAPGSGHLWDPEARDLLLGSPRIPWHPLGLLSTSVPPGEESLAKTEVTQEGATKSRQGEHSAGAA